MLGNLIFSGPLEVQALIFSWDFWWTKQPKPNTLETLAMFSFSETWKTSFDEKSHGQFVLRFAYLSWLVVQSPLRDLSTIMIVKGTKLVIETKLDFPLQSREKGTKKITKVWISIWYHQIELGENPSFSKRKCTWIFQLPGYSFSKTAY